MSVTSRAACEATLLRRVELSMRNGVSYSDFEAEIDRMVSASCVQSNIHERWVSLGEACGAVRCTIDGTSGQKVGGTSKIVTWSFEPVMSRTD